MQDHLSLLLYRFYYTIYILGILALDDTVCQRCAVVDRRELATQVLLQGVVDCAVIEPDGITVIDFKTDYVNEQTLSEVSNRYKSQILAYADALSRIYVRPVKKATLYFLHIGKDVTVL